MHGGPAHRVQQRTDLPPGQGAEGDGGKGRAKRGVADLGHGHIQGLGDNAQGVDIGGAALVRAHAGGGVTLHMFDGAVAFAGR